MIPAAYNFQFEGVGKEFPAKRPCFVLPPVLNQNCHKPVPVNLKTVSKMSDVSCCE